MVNDLRVCVHYARSLVREGAKVVAGDILDNEGKALAGDLDAVGAVGQTSFPPNVRMAIGEPGHGLKRRATVPIRALFGGPQRRHTPGRRVSA